MTIRPQSYLRKSFDGAESIVGAPNIKNTAGATRHAERMAKVPVWALNDELLRQLLKRAFPGLQTNPVQREKAARCIRIIHLYYRVGYTALAVAQELEITLKAVECSLRRMNRLAIKQGKPRGRPRKNTEGIEASYESTIL